MASESSRQKEEDKTLNDFKRLVLECSNMSAKSFVTELTESVTSLLSHFDVALTLDDIILGGRTIFIFYLDSSIFLVTSFFAL